MPQYPTRRSASGPLTLRDAIDSLFQDSFVLPQMARGDVEPFAGALAVDVVETPDAIVVKSALPGVKPDDVDISVTGNVLRIRAESRLEQEEKQHQYHRRELSYGTYERLLSLPTEVNPDAANATFEHGLLTLMLPKAEHTRPRAIKVQAGRPQVAQHGEAGQPAAKPSSPASQSEGKQAMDQQATKAAR